MKIYISGKIGTDIITDEIRAKFNEAAAYIEKCGHEAINPIDPLYQALGSNYLSDEVSDIYTRHLLFDLYKLATCDAIFLLPDWYDSPGATAEFSFAVATGKKVAYGPGYSFSSTGFSNSLSFTFELSEDDEAVNELFKSLGIDICEKPSSPPSSP